MAKGILGSMIAKYRKEARLTQEELGSMVGVSTQAVSRWECGGTPDVELLPAIADCLHISIDTLFGRAADETTDLKELLHLRIKNAPKEECMELLMDYLWSLQEAAQINARPDMENVFAMMPFEVTDRTGEANPKACLSTYMWGDDRSYMYYGFAKDKRFAAVLPEPKLGFASALKNTEEYVKLFALLAKPHYLEMLVDINMREPKEHFTVRSAAARVQISEEEAGKILEELYDHMMLERMEVTDENGVMEVYNIQSDANLYTLLFFSEMMMQSVETLHINADTRTKPVFHAKPGTDSLTPGWDIRERET